MIHPGAILRRMLQIQSRQQFGTRHHFQRCDQLNPARSSKRMTEISLQTADGNAVAEKFPESRRFLPVPLNGRRRMGVHISGRPGCNPCIPVNQFQAAPDRGGVRLAQTCSRRTGGISPDLAENRGSAPTGVFQTLQNDDPRALPADQPPAVRIERTRRFFRSNAVESAGSLNQLE